MVWLRSLCQSFDSYAAPLLLPVPPVPVPLSVVDVLDPVVVPAALGAGRRAVVLSEGQVVVVGLMASLGGVVWSPGDWRTRDI